MSSSERFAVSFHADAAALYRRAKEANQTRPRSAEAIMYRAIHALIESVLRVPEHATSSRYALRAPLTGIFRSKHGRFRLFWIASAKHKRVIILDVDTTGLVGARGDRDHRRPRARAEKVPGGSGRATITTSA